jgi:hypothetical protein
MEIAADEMTRFHEAGSIAVEVMDGLGDRMSGFTSGFSAGASENMAELSQAFGDLGEALGQLFGLDEGGSIMDLLFGTEEGWSSAGEEIGSFVTGALTDLVNIITSIVNGINDVGQAFEDFTGWIDDWANRIGSIEIDWSFLQPPDWLAGAGDWVGDLFGGEDAVQAASNLAGLADAIPDTASIIDLPSLERAESAAASIAETMQRAGEIDLAPVVRAALNEAQSVLASEDWSGHGARLMDTLAAGVRSGSGPLASAVSAAISQGVSQGVAAGLSSAYDARRQSALQDGAE